MEVWAEQCSVDDLVLPLCQPGTDIRLQQFLQTI